MQLRIKGNIFPGLYPFILFLENLKKNSAFSSCFLLCHDKRKPRKLWSVTLGVPQDVRATAVSPGAQGRPKWANKANNHVMYLLKMISTFPSIF